MKAWLLKLVRSSAKMIMDEALKSARLELLKELETSTMFKEGERVQVENISQMLVDKVLAELDKRI